MSHQQTYRVTGMTCAHCAASVSEEVEQLPGVEIAEVDLETGIVLVISADGVPDEDFRDAVAEAGYQVA